MGFTEDVNALKDKLVQLYQTKSSMVARRETYRYQYTQAWRTQLDTVCGEVLNRVMQYQNPSLNQLVSQYLTDLKLSIPMATADGRTVEGYKSPDLAQPSPPWVIRAGENFLGKLDRWFARKPPGVVYIEGSGEEVRPLYEINAGLLVAKENMKPVQDTFGTKNGGRFYLPLSPDDAGDYLGALYPANQDPDRNNLISSFMSLINEDYTQGGAGSVAQVFTKGKNELYNILIDDTFSILAHQLTINDAEKRIDAMILAAGMAQGASPVETSDAVQDTRLTVDALKEQDKQQTSIPVVVPTGATIDANGPVPSAFSQIQPQVAAIPQASSKVPLFLALAAGLFFLKKD